MAWSGLGRADGRERKLELINRWFDGCAERLDYQVNPLFYELRIDGKERR
jgi:hypothetical protein